MLAGACQGQAKGRTLSGTSMGKPAGCRGLSRGGSQLRRPPHSLRANLQDSKAPDATPAPAISLFPCLLHFEGPSSTLVKEPLQQGPDSSSCWGSQGPHPLRSKVPQGMILSGHHGPTQNSKLLGHHQQARVDPGEAKPHQSGDTGSWAWVALESTCVGMRGHSCSHQGVKAQQPGKGLPGTPRARHSPLAPQG